ncbi:MAG: DnaJ domain-containing protein [Kofleriaceae bacterium]
MATGALSIKLRCASWQQLATIYRRDLSRGTMFLKAASPPAIGTSVRIDLTLPSASVITLTGVVQSHSNDAQRGQGVELKLAPIPTGSIWLIESALASEQQRRAIDGAPQAPLPPTTTGPVPTIGEGNDQAAAEDDLIRALVAEAESLRKLNPFMVLGVGYEATNADVRAAFGGLTKRYHPDRFARYESAELRTVAAEIFILIRDAYRKLGDEAGRLAVLQAFGRTAVPRAVPGPRAPTAPVPPAPRSRGPTSAGMSSTMAIPRTVPDQRSGPIDGVRAPMKPASTERQPIIASPPPVISENMEPSALEELLDRGKLEDALAGYKVLSKKQPQDRTLRAGVELCEGLRAMQNRDRLEAAQRFETALEIDPSNERAARELADMRRQATNERKGLLSRLMGKKET